MVGLLSRADMKNEIYEPAEDSLLLLKYVKQFSEGKKVLDVGCGSGILSFGCVEAKSVLGVDINKKAIDYCQKIKKEKKLKNYRFIYSDLFSNVEGKFDLIVFNPPYLPCCKKDRDVAIDGGKKGYELIEKFLRNMNEYLRENGKVLLLFSSKSHKNIIDVIIDEVLFNKKLLESKKMFFEELFVYLLWKSELLKKLNRKVKKIEYFTKGKRGLIFKGIMKKKIVIIKIKNPNSKASSRIINEGKFLNMLNKKGIGPKLHFYNRDFIIMDYIKGDFIIDFIEKNKNNRRKIIKIIKKVLCQMYKLDKMKINKLEMTFPYKHIIIRGETPYLIDFERCYYTKNPKNVTQFLHFIATSGIIELSKIIFYARRYKKNQSLKNFKNIIDKIK